jgi:hypothetical protein
MRALTICISLILLPLGIFCQDVTREYNYAKYSNFFHSIVKRIPCYTDKIILSSDSTYFRKEIGTCGTFISYEKKGFWKMKNDSLFLHENKFQVPETDGKLYDSKSIEIFLLKRNSIIPIIDGNPIRNKKYKIK